MDKSTSRATASVVLGVMFLVFSILAPIALWLDAIDTLLWVGGAGAFIVMAIIGVNADVSYQHTTIKHVGTNQRDARYIADDDDIIDGEYSMHGPVMRHAKPGGFAHEIAYSHSRAKRLMRDDDETE